MSQSIHELEHRILYDTLSVEPLAPEKPGFTERHPGIYLVLALFFSLLGYGFILVFPAFSLYTFLTVPADIIQAQSYSDSARIISQIILATFSGWIAYEFYRHKMQSPGGRPLKEAEAPRLNHLIDEICQEFSARKPQRIRITKDYELKLISSPVNGYPIRTQRTLVIGMPLIQCMTPKQFRILLYRELSHSYHAWLRPEHWITTIRSLFIQLQQNYRQSDNKAALISRPFFSVFNPLLDFISQPVIALEENNIDQLCMDRLAREELIDALLGYYLCQHYLNNEFWIRLNNSAYIHQQPPYLPYASIENFIRSKTDPNDIRIALRNILEKIRNTNPQLARRLERLNIHTSQFDSRLEQSAAEFYFESLLVILIKQFDTVWYRANQFNWQKKHQEGKEEQQRLEEYRIEAEQGVISESSLWDYLVLLNKYYTEDRLISCYKVILQLHCRDARVLLNIGRTLLDYMDEDGIKALEKAMQINPGYTLDACQTITQYYVHCGNSRMAQNYRRKALAYQVDAA